MFYKRGDTWWVKFKSRGKVVRESTGEPDRGRAEIQGARIRLKYHNQEADAPCGQRSTLAQVSAADIARAEGNRVTPMQLAALRYLWGFALKHFGPDSDPAVITYESLEEMVSALRGLELRGQSIRRVVQCVKRGLRIAAARRWVDTLPLVWPRVKSDPPDPKRTGKWVPVEVIRDWLASMDPLARLHAVGVAGMGIRSAEMSKGDPDWIHDADPGTAAAAVIRLPPDATKTRHQRAIPVGADTAEMLLTYWAYPDRPKSHRRARETARKAIGYPKPITLRDLRHTFATLAERLDRKAAQDLLGHTTERMTQRYLHSDTERLADTSAGVWDALGLAGGTFLGGTVEPVSEKGLERSRVRTCDPLRVRQKSSSDYSNLRSISDSKSNSAPSRTRVQGSRRGHSRK